MEFPPPEKQSDESEKGGCLLEEGIGGESLQWTEIRKSRKHFRQKIIIRDATVVLICIVLPFVDSVRKLCAGLESLIAIIGLLFLLTPIQNTSVGPEVSGFLHILVLWPIHLLAGIFSIHVFQERLSGYLILLMVVDTAIFTYAFLYSHVLVPALLSFIVYVILVPSMYGNFAFENLATEEAISSSYKLLFGASISLGLPYVIHLAGVLLIFPWSSVNSLKDNFVEMWFRHYELLRAIGPAYREVAEITLLPSRHNSREEIFTRETTNRLLEACKALLDDSVKCYTDLRNVLMESRWSFDGSGYDLVDMYFKMRKYSRFSRAAVSDYREKIERTRSRMESFKQVLVTEKDIENENQDGLVMVNALEDINKLLVSTCLYLAKTTLVDSKDIRTLKAHARIHTHIHRELSKKMQLVERKALIWAKKMLSENLEFYDAENRLSHDEPMKKTLLLNYIVLLKAFVNSYAHIWEPLVNRKTARKISFKDWRFSTSLHHRLHVEKSASHSLQRPNMNHSQVTFWIHASLQVFSESEFKIALKLTVGAILLSIPGFVRATHDVFDSVKATQAIFTFLVILYRMHVGLVFQRVIHRISGIFCGFIYGGIVWSLAVEVYKVYPHNTLNSAIFILANFPLLIIYFWMRERTPGNAYIGFAIARTYTSLIGPLLSANDNKASIACYWESGGWVMLLSSAGAVLALFLGTFIWPISGKKALRMELSKAYMDMKLQIEGLILHGYGSYENPEDFENVEMDIAARLYIRAEKWLDVARIEKFDIFYPDVSVNEYDIAVDHSRRLLQILWKIQHIGYITTYVLRKRAKQMSPIVARQILAWHRGVTSCYFVIALVLANSDLSSLPVLRPLAATPFLLEEFLHDFLITCYKDKRLMREIYASDDINFLASFITFRDMMTSIGIQLEGMFAFMDKFRKVPIYANCLREEDFRSFSAHSIHQDDHTIVAE